MIYTSGITPELTDYVLLSCRNTDGPKSVKAERQQNFHARGSETISVAMIVAMTKKNLQDVKDWPFRAACQEKKTAKKVMLYYQKSWNLCSCKTKMADISHPGFCPRAMNRPKLWLSSINKKWRFYMSWHKGGEGLTALSFFPPFHSQNQFTPVTCHVVTHQSAPFSPWEWKFNWDICAAQKESPTAAACRARQIHFTRLTELLCCKRSRLLNLWLGDKIVDDWKH